MAALVMDWTDPQTLAPVPQSAVKIDDARVHLAGQSCVLTVSRYASTAAADAGATPITTDAVTLTFAEIQALRDSFAQQLYGLLLNRPEFAGATLVA